MVTCLIIDGGGILWAGTWWGGLAKFDGSTWTVYNDINSALPNDLVFSLATDVSGNMWIGTVNGLAKFIGNNWTIFNSNNSGLPGDVVRALAIDGSSNIWIGTWGDGLAKFDGITWTVYNASNSGLPDDHVSSLAIDGSGNKWIGTDNGLAEFDGTNWEVYNYNNSGLPDPEVMSLNIDINNNKWIGTWVGLAVYQEGGDVAVEEGIVSEALQDFLLYQNYPNPFNPTTTIELTIPHAEFVTLKIYNILGEEVATLVSEKLPVGRYKYEWDARGLASGVYFYRLHSNKYIQSHKMLLLQ